MDRRWLSGLIDIGIFAAATAATHLAQAIDRPITAVLVYISGVILIAVHSGLHRALFAAIAASLIFNFFLNEPVFEFGMTTLDEAVPLLAFNVTALVTGVMVGRLKDAEIRAHRANSDAAFLLTVSDRLQSALEVTEVETIVRELLPTQGVESVELYLSQGDHYFRPSTGEVRGDRLNPLLEEVGADRPKHAVVLELVGVRGALGIAKFKFTDDLESRPKIPDLQSISALLALAIERCILLEQVAEEQAKTRGEALKDSLLSSVSHDLRTPITVIEAAAGALLSPQIDLPEAEKVKLLETVIEQCHRLDRYTSEILDVGRIQAGIDTSAMQPMDLADVTNMAVRQIAGADLDARFERRFSSAPVLVLGSPALLEQAIVNVIHNAVKFGGDAPVEVTIDEQAGVAELSVRDSGPGVPIEEQPRIFDRFYKAGSGSKEGTGLGLFIAKGFVEACGGSIRVISPIDERGGTCVILSFPAVRAKEPELAMAAS